MKDRGDTDIDQEILSTLRYLCKKMSKNNLQIVYNDIQM